MPTLTGAGPVSGRCARDRPEGDRHAPDRLDLRGRQRCTATHHGLRHL